MKFVVCIIIFVFAKTLVEFALIVNSVFRLEVRTYERCNVLKKILFLEIIFRWYFYWYFHGGRIDEQTKKIVQQRNKSR